ncbi:MAG: acyl carrier protein [Oceanicaulis sp.]
MTAETLTLARVKTEIVRAINEAMEHRAEPVDETTDLQALAADSLQIVIIANILEDALKIELDPSLLYAAETVEGLARDILQFSAESF